MEIECMLVLNPGMYRMKTKFNTYYPLSRKLK